MRDEMMQFGEFINHSDKFVIAGWWCRLWGLNEILVGWFHRWIWRSQVKVVGLDEVVLLLPI